MAWYRDDDSLYFSVVYEDDKPISGTCSDGREIDSKTLREFNGWDTSVLGCD